MIVTCLCNYPAQDLLHGKGRRVANPTKDENPKKYRCTVCKSLVVAKDNVEVTPNKKKGK